jgi:hypothetical protein
MTQLQPIRFEVKLELTSPVLTKAAGAVGLGIDAGMLRDPQGNSAFHFTHIKGKLREAWCELHRLMSQPDPDFMARWLGSESETGGFEPERGELSFDAYWRAKEPPAKPGQVPPRYRVRIDPETGAAADGALLVTESPWPAGAPVTFTGSIHGRLTDEERENLLHWLRRGFNLIPAFGANKGQGFGRLAKATVQDHPDPGTPIKLPSELRSATRVGLRIRPLDPFCFARFATGTQNHFVTKTMIPGAAVIAALARRCRAEPGRFKALEGAIGFVPDSAAAGGNIPPLKLVISEARPVRKDAKERPIVIPLTVVSLPKAGLKDVTHISEPGTVGGEVPTFQVDWKDGDRERAQGLLNPAAEDPHKYLLIRTAIDPGTLTSAEGKLFSMETVVPDECDWLANLDLGEVEDPAPVLRDLAILLTDSLTHLGKTKARASVTIEAPFEPSVKSRPVQGDTVVIHLQTPAALLPDDFSAPSTGDMAELHAAYDLAWRSLSGDTNGSSRCLLLRHFFAAQQLYGGAQWWSRCTPGSTYRPRLMTRAGSVFVLRVQDPAGATALLAQWQRTGLPQLPGIRGGEDWRRNPWIRQKGYGEILVNPDIASALGGAAS